MKYDLDITHLYKTPENWEEDYKKYIQLIEELKAKQDFINSSDNFYEYMKLLLDTDNLADKLFCYCKRQVDIKFSLEELKQKMNDILKQYGELEILKNKFEATIIRNNQKIKEFIKEERFKEYLRFINLILRKESHIIEEKDQSILSNYMSDLQKLKDDYQDILVNKCDSVNVNIDGKEVEIKRQNINELMKDREEEHRIIYSKSYVSTYNKHNEKITEILISKYKNDINLAKIRNFNSLIELKMFDYELNTSIFETLIEKINKNLNIKHEYNKLRAKIFGLNIMHSYDTALSLVENYDIKINIEEAIQIIKNSLSVFGKKYIDIIDRIFNEGWIDLYPKKEKINRSYTSITYEGVPYIIVNFSENLTSVRNLIHEIGHSVNVTLSKEKNKSHNFNTSFFLTEVASKVNEMLFDEYILKHSNNKEEKKYILYNSINSLINSIFNQTMLSEFENTIINKITKEEQINNEYLNELYFSLVNKYEGPDFKNEETSKYSWMLVTHLILQDSYYLYQYPIGACISLYIVNGIINEEENIIEKYLQFLSLGNSVNITESLNILGININDSSYIDFGLNYLNNKIKEFSELF